MQCFEGVEQYQAELVSLLTELEAGKFLQQSVETVLRSRPARQLLAEVTCSPLY